MPGLQVGGLQHRQYLERKKINLVSQRAVYCAAPRSRHGIEASNSLGGVFTDDDVRSGTFCSKKLAIIQIPLDNTDAGIDFLYFLSAFLTAYEYSVAVLGVSCD